MATKSPPNRVACSTCRHEWLAHTWGICPKCNGTALRAYCHARSKSRPGGHCVRLVAAPGRCRFHGGGKNRPLPQLRTTRIGLGARLPDRYVQVFEEALRDPKLFALQESMALLSARRAELVDRLSTTEAGELWRLTAAAFAEADAARNAGDGTGLEEAMKRLAGLVQRGIGDSAQWAELLVIERERRATIETEARRVERERSSMSAEQVLALVAGIASLVREVLGDDAKYRAFAHRLKDFARLDDAAVGVN